ncbi:MAG: glycosyltransferase [Bacteroidales bacterium]
MLQIVSEILFWLIITLIAHTYIFHSVLLIILSKIKSPKEFLYYDNTSEQLPCISIVMSAFNEQKVIEQKINSIFQSNYPTDKIELLVGSDNSSDSTPDILLNLQKQYPQLKPFIFQERQGKIKVINKLIAQCSHNIIITTDANVMFHTNTIYELIKYFKDKNIGLVDSRIINTGKKKDGISIQESFYISREVKIKNIESLLWGTMIGPFGGCFAIRKELFKEVPDNFLVDDFYINMIVLLQDYYAINNIQALVFEDVSNNASEEFRRKVRISSGNFQNMFHFLELLVPVNNELKLINPVSLWFNYVSHKVLRWLTPFLIIQIPFLLLVLSYQEIYRYLLILYIISIIIPLTDILLRKFNVNITFFRFFTHFYNMNTALLVGFIKYLKGIKSSVWQPTKRFQ